MNYLKHYRTLMLRAVGRELTGYGEWHHIVPRALQGKNTAQVKLTPEEHFVAHQLLAKAYPSNRKIVAGALMMGDKTNKLYGWIRRKYRDSVCGEGNPNFGKELSVETKYKMSLVRRGRGIGQDNPMFGKKQSEELNHKHSIRMTGKGNPNFGKTTPIEVRRKIAEGNRGKKLSAETRYKMSLAAKRRYQNAA